MPKLTHYRLCPQSRTIRLVLAEMGIAATLAEEPPWEQRPGFLALNPAGELPVLELESGLVLCGAYAISEYLAEPDPARGANPRAMALLPGNREDRAEARRLVDWFRTKMNREVTRELLWEKLYGRLSGRPDHTPDPGILRAVRANLRYHLSYLGYLSHHRRWLGGDEMSLADLTAAAELSSIDYLGEVPWEDHPAAKGWYARMKSRPSFRPVLADRIAGVPPPLSYTDLDF